MKRILLCHVAIFLLVLSCSSKPPKNNSEQKNASSTTKSAPTIEVPSMEAKQLANEQQTTLVTELSFKRGSEELTTSSRSKLKDLAQQALAKGLVDMIKVISWADQEYPSANQKKLSADQLELASNRNNEIKNYLENIYSKNNIEPDVQLISMAKRPNAFNNIISSDDARIKKSLETSGIPTTDSKSKNSPKSSRSIVIIKLVEGKR